MADDGRRSIVYLDHVAILSGGELALCRLLTGLDVRAHVILGEDGPLRPVLEQAGAVVEILPLGGVGSVRKDALTGVRAMASGALGTARYIWVLRGRLRALRPDVVHTNSLKSGLYGSIAARLARVPVVWHLRDRLSEDYLPPAAVRLTRTALRWLPDGVIVNSESTRETAHLPTTGRRVTPVLVAPSPLTPTRHDDVVRPDEPQVFGIVGRLAPWKGQDLFLRAFAAAFPEGTQRATVIGAALFGEDEYAASLPVLARELGLADRVHFLGFSGQVDRELAGLHVLVHASRSPEPFGQVVVEGMAQGLAVIAARAGGPEEIVTDGVDGLLVTPGDQDAFAAAMLRLSRDPQLRASLGAAGRRRSQDYSPAVIGPRVQAFYDRIAAAHRRR